MQENQEVTSPFRKLANEELNRLSVEEFKTSSKLHLVVVLDNVRSLHNIGSIFRTCDAFRVASIFLCGISATPPHREIHKSALGAENSVDWKYFAQTEEALSFLRANGYKLITVEQTKNSTLLGDFNPSVNEKYGLIFGNEVHGVSQPVTDLSDMTLEIPQLGTKHSFNVSVTAGIVLWDLFRKLQIS